MSWVWVSKAALVLLRDESLSEHGRRAGLRDARLLDSALNRPLNLLAYGEPDFADLAASYAVGLAKNHAFVDGIKRAPCLAVGLFLYLNGYRLRATQAEATLTVLTVASGDITEAAFAAWLRQHAQANA
jgi:death-on-curing protein